MRTTTTDEEMIKSVLKILGKSTIPEIKNIYRGLDDKNILNYLSKLQMTSEIQIDEKVCSVKKEPLTAYYLTPELPAGSPLITQLMEKINEMAKKIKTLEEQISAILSLELGSDNNSNKEEKNVVQELAKTIEKIDAKAERILDKAERLESKFEEIVGRTERLESAVEELKTVKNNVIEVPVTKEPEPEEPVKINQDSQDVLNELLSELT